MKKLALTLSAILLATAVYAQDVRRMAQNVAGYVSDNGTLHMECNGERIMESYGRLGQLRLIYRITDFPPHGVFHAPDKLQVLYVGESRLVKVIDDFAADGTPEFYGGFKNVEEMNKAYVDALQAFEARTGIGLLAQNF